MLLVELLECDLCSFSKNKIMNIFSFAKLLLRASSELDLISGQFEVFIKVSSNGDLIIGRGKPIDMGFKFDNERLEDYLDFLLIHGVVVSSYEIVCDDVFRIRLKVISCKPIGKTG